MLRKRLKHLAEKIKTVYAGLEYRPFVDSAPVMERPLAKKAGLGWTGKHTLLINQHDSSWFFLGELLVNIPLPIDQSVQEQCGHCVACMKQCPTQAIISPYQVDERRCISYLTIEKTDRALNNSGHLWATVSMGVMIVSLSVPGIAIALLAQNLIFWHDTNLTKYPF